MMLISPGIGRGIISTASKVCQSPFWMPIRGPIPMPIDSFICRLQDELGRFGSIANISAVEDIGGRPS